MIRFDFEGENQTLIGAYSKMGLVLINILSFKASPITSIASIYSMSGSGGESHSEAHFYDNFVIKNTYCVIS